MSLVFAGMKKAMDKIGKIREEEKVSHLKRNAQTISQNGQDLNRLNL